jgi:hypothetical protein
LEEKWQFLPVVKQDRRSSPKLILVNGEAVALNVNRAPKSGFSGAAAPLMSLKE